MILKSRGSHAETRQSTAYVGHMLTWNRHPELIRVATIEMDGQHKRSRLSSTLPGDRDVREDKSLGRATWHRFGVARSIHTDKTWYGYIIVYIILSRAHVLVFFLPFFQVPCFFVFFFYIFISPVLFLTFSSSFCFSFTFFLPLRVSASLAKIYGIVYSLRFLLAMKFHYLYTLLLYLWHVSEWRAQ